MSVNSKPDLHPDAESLNAFAEEALGAQERDAMMAHLAECSRCREIVFLAREAAEEAAPELLVAAAVAAGPEEGARKETWFRSWRFAWVPVGALVAMVTVAYVVHVRHREMAAEQALVAAVRNSEIAKAEVKPPMEMAAASAPVTAQKALKPPAPKLADRVVTMQAAESPAAEARALEISNSSAIKAPQAALSAAAHRQEAEIAARNEALARASAAYETSGMAEKRLKAGAGGAAKDAQSVGMIAAAPAPARAAAMYSAKPMDLPSGLAAVSTATNQSCTVAVDAAGGVFVRYDAGKPWESVAKQWSGRAVSVRRGTAAAIELVNDQGQVWVSTDGRNWVAK